MIHFENQYKDFVDIFQNRLDAILGEKKDYNFKFCLNHPFCINNSPFSCNPNTNNSIIISYNEELIKKIELNIDEQYAMLLHEINHCYCKSTVDKTNEEQQMIEKECDELAYQCDYGYFMITGLIKLKQLDIRKDNIDDRIAHLLKKNLFFRPKWTCGRYNKKHNVAIFYNLISSNSFFFEDKSAEVIGAILNVKRNESFNVVEIAKATQIDDLSIFSFLEELASYGLLTIVTPGEDYEQKYRKQIANDRKSSCQQNDYQNNEQSLGTSDAELSYFNAVKETGIATSIMFELTYKCSEKCLHCYNPGATRNESETSYRNSNNALCFDDYKRIIDELYANGLVKVCLTGGDPFSNPSTWDIIDYLYQKGIATDIFTNGQAIYKDASRLSSYYPRIVGISIYSSSPSVHDKITRINGSWEKSMKLIADLSDLAVPTNIKCCIMQPNIKTYRGIIDIAAKYGAQPQFEVNIRESNDGDFSAKSLRLNKEQLQIVLIDGNLPYNLLSDINDYKKRKCDAEKSTCMIGIDDFSITPSGNVQPCVAFPLSFGNLKGQSWNAIIQNNPLLNDWQNCKLKEFDKCGNFEYCSCCKPCAGLNYIEHGDFRKAAETSCYMAKIRFELLERISNGEDLLQGKNIDEALNECNNDIDINIKRQYYPKG